MFSDFKKREDVPENLPCLGSCLVYPAGKLSHVQIHVNPVIMQKAIRHLPIKDAKLLFFPWQALGRPQGEGGQPEPEAEPEPGKAGNVGNALQKATI